ncbi:MAG: nuclear transport factor 2 family protein [Methylobacteriaceae bacterium]|nr:nuclear transport factor 2 family protein [Methylobacteriaceae bacterium]
MMTATLRKQTSHDESEILALFDSLRQAHHDKDGEAIAAAYAKDAIVCDLSPPLFHRGVDAKEKQAWLDGWDGPIELDPRDFSLTVRDDVAFAQGYTRMSGTPKAAGRPVGFWLRDTICLNRTNGRWKIIHMHSSVPFYMDGSLRPAFDLEPVEN